jgi:IS30 family transposase
MERVSHIISRDGCVEARTSTLANESWNYRTIIGQRLGVSHTTISRGFQRFREVSEYIRGPGQVKPRVTTAVQIVF